MSLSIRRARSHLLSVLRGREAQVNDAIRAGLCCPHNYLRNRYGLCADCKKGHPMTTEEIVDEKTGQKLVKQKKRKPKAEKPAVTAESEVPKGSKKKMKQTDLPGTEPKRYPDIDEAAEALAEIRGERMDLTRKETEAASILMARMKKHNVRDYEFGKIEAHIEVTEEKVKVKIHEDEEDA